jgi:hypothetical protein
VQSFNAKPEFDVYLLSIVNQPFGNGGRYYLTPADGGGIPLTAGHSQNKFDKRCTFSTFLNIFDTAFMAK